MIKNKNIFVILILSVLFVGCSDVIDPAQENIKDKNNTYDDPNFGLGLLTQGYARIPTNGYNFSEVATDDAVSNVSTNGYLRLATGQWSASNDATSRWTSCYSGIQYMNIVLSEVDKMTFSEDPLVNNLFKGRIKGEAYGLRAMFMYYLLQSHAGWANGKLLGVPIYLKELDINSNYNVPRETFNDCTAQIYSDINNAITYLPTDYVDVASTASIPPRYNTPDMTVPNFNRAMGVKFRGLMSGRIVRAIRSQVALMAASPAFATGTANGSNGTWEAAAAYSAEVIALNGGLAAGLPTTFASGVSWYRNTSEISALSAGSNPPETLWRAATSNNNDLERDHFPPTLFGNGNLNPTQNLVDAFPASNGYPISNPLSNYSSTNPYANRDPRLKEFIVYHGTTAGVTNAQINMTTGNDAVNKIATSTRTGYYMKKLLRQDVNYNPSGRNTQTHYRPRIRYTEIFLNYAEAANEAWGSISDPKGYGYTAYDVIKAIRKRALGISADPYLESIKADKSAMRQLIRNERRLELSFEGFRFWDLRRWKVALSELSAPAMGITVSGTLAAPVYSTPNVVENRVFKDHMYYGPIPYNETRKYTNLLQNDGWNN